MAQKETPKSSQTPDVEPLESPVEKSLEAEPETIYRLNIDNTVVEKISALAMRQIDGVIDMKGSLFSKLQQGLGMSDLTKGVDASVLDNSDVMLDMNIILEYGKSAVDVFDKIKELVGDDLSFMTGLRVREMTVNVVDVMTKEEYENKSNSDSDSDEESSEESEE